MKPHRKSRSSPVPSPGVRRPVQGGVIAAAFASIPLLAVGASEDFRHALDHTTGVLCLVALTASVAWGLLATDRLLLSPRHRLLSQAVHRATATASLGLLLLHAAVKLALGHIGPVGALIPFGLGVTGAAGLIGFGTLAGLLVIVTAAGGALRSALAGRAGAAGRWRALHMIAYPAWCLALVHGLFAGRPAAGWVVAAYCLALIGVAGALSLRLLPRPTRRIVADRLPGRAGDGGRGRRAAEPEHHDPAAPLDGFDRVDRFDRFDRVDPEDFGPGSFGSENFGPEGYGPRTGLDRLDGVPPQRGPAPADGFRRPAPLGRDPRPPGLTAPSPRLYEAPAPYGAERVAGVHGRGAERGISAAYRAVSQAGEAAERGPGAGEAPDVPRAGPAPGHSPPPGLGSPGRPHEDGPPGRPHDPGPPGRPHERLSEPPPPHTPPRYHPGPYEPTPRTPPPYEPPAPGPPPYGRAGRGPVARSTVSHASPSPYGIPEPGARAPYDDGDTATPGPLVAPPPGEPWNTSAGDRP
ncbi:hypothetical protein [Streptomyces sp. NPDC014894]|uniref:hypothetical protein n=1 Tax=Streptomyces sp. NPDC014894 TaxID=3364931 RepID=UPI0036F9296B